MGTHLNAYKEEAVVALSAVHDALGEAEAKLAALINKLNESATSEVASESEAVVPVAVKAKSPAKKKS